MRRRRAAGVRQEQVGLDLIFEYHIEIAVGDGDTLVGNAVSASFPASQRADRVNGSSEQYLTFGARVRPVAGLVLDAGLDVGLSSRLPLWLAAADVEPPARRGLRLRHRRRRGRTKVVTKTVTREINRGAIEGKLRGFVRDAATKKPIGGATIRYVTRRGTAQLTADDGSFLSYGFAPGPLSLEVSRDDYETMRSRRRSAPPARRRSRSCSRPSRPGGPSVRVKVSDDAGMPTARRRCARLDVSSGAVVDAVPETHGRLRSQAAARRLARRARDRLSREVQDHHRRRRAARERGDRAAQETDDLARVARQERDQHQGHDPLRHQQRRDQADGEQLLDEVADVLAKHSEIRRIRVEGHTDNRGNAENNLELSKARAASVVAYLVKSGVDASRLESEGYGATQPLVPNITPVQRAKNRRVAFKILEQGPRQ